jgi:hypothetical protein
VFSIGVKGVCRLPVQGTPAPSGQPTLRMIKLGHSFVNSARGNSLRPERDEPTRTGSHPFHSEGNRKLDEESGWVVGVEGFDWVIEQPSSQGARISAIRNPKSATRLLPQMDEFSTANEPEVTNQPGPARPIGDGSATAGQRRSLTGSSPKKPENPSKLIYLDEKNHPFDGLRTVPSSR